MTARPSRIDLFCRVIDNYGDIGVCWRLARQLAMEEGLAVRLIVDRLEVAQPLVLAIKPELDHQVVDSVTLQRWQETGLQCQADLVIEAFACELPADYLESMAACASPPVWINLEYLSAEPWVQSHHGLPSPHPRLALIKHFFFPGFMGNTGGLLREQNIVGPPAPAVRKTPMRIFVFAYDADCIDSLCHAISFDRCSATVVVPGNAWDGKLKHWCDPQAYNALNTAPVIEFVDFVQQRDFDALLASQDVLMVRGEDSLVRALWSAKPFVWQLYRQAGGAHRPKLEAFLDWYSQGMSPPLCNAWQEFSRAWNGWQPGAIMSAWPKLREQWEPWCAFAHRRAAEQMQQPDLASNLLSFFGKMARM